MRRSELLTRLMKDVQADLQDYEQLRETLTAQFDAAIHHDAPSTLTLAETLTQLVSQIEQRRQDRVRIVTALLNGKTPLTVTALLQSLPEHIQTALTPSWQKLEALVRECKQLNLRNCQLMAEQQAIMHRVMHGEEGTYAEV